MKKAWWLGCAEPASIHGGKYHVSGYDVGSSVGYECNYGYEMIGASRAFCMVPSEWYPSPPICKCEWYLLITRIKNVKFWLDNACTSDCEVCDKKTGVCLRQQITFNLDIHNPSYDEDEECIDEECTLSNIDDNWDSKKNENVCNPPCSFGTQCINRRCEPNLTPYCPVPCRPGQLCIDGRCGCYKGKFITIDW